MLFLLRSFLQIFGYTSFGPPWPKYVTTSAAHPPASLCISDLDKAVVILFPALPNKSAIRIYLISVALGTCLTRVCKVRVLGFAADFDSLLVHIDPTRREGICRRFSPIWIASYSVSDSGMRVGNPPRSLWSFPEPLQGSTLSGVCKTRLLFQNGNADLNSSGRCQHEVHRQCPLSGSEKHGSEGRIDVPLNTDSSGYFSLDAQHQRRYPLSQGSITPSLLERDLYDPTYGKCGGCLRKWPPYLCLLVFARRRQRCETSLNPLPFRPPSDSLD